jgi:uncharacterized repeat protein (TIGR01451 family)
VIALLKDFKMFKFTKLLTLLLLLDVSCAFALDTPTEDFIDNKDGTVTHKKTGLSWQRCSVGQTWTGSSCSGTASAMNWDTAATYKNKTDCNQWRLPHIDELNTITEHGSLDDFVNNTIFPNTPRNWFWSASVMANANFFSSWVGGGEVNYRSSVGSYAVRLVHGGQSCSLDASTPTSDFSDNNNGTVTHTKTGLTWQRCSVGQTWNGSSCTGSASRMTYISAMSQTSSLTGYSDWRLPTLNELHTIVEYKNYSPAINTTIFPNTPDDAWAIFWSASVLVFKPSIPMVVNFQIGNGANESDNDRSYAVRFVRGTWTAPTITTPVVSKTIDLTTTLSQSSSRVKTNENLTYTATVINNGTGTANNSLLKFYLPPRNVSIVSMPSDCVTTGKSITCSLGSLAAGASITRLFKVSYTKSGGSSVSALVLTDSNDANSANNVSRIVTAITK